MNYLNLYPLIKKHEFYLYDAVTTYKLLQFYKRLSINI